MRKSILILTFIAASIFTASSRTTDRVKCTEWETVSTEVHFYPSFGVTEIQEQRCIVTSGHWAVFRRAIEW